MPGVLGSEKRKVRPAGSRAASAAIPKRRQDGAEPGKKGPSRSASLSGRDQWIILAIALLVRLIHIFAIQDSAYFTHPIVDAQTYDEAARALAAGAGHPDKVFWQPPGYSFFLGFVYAISGHNLLAARVVQAALGAVTAVLTARIGAHVFGRGVGLAAGLAAAVYSTLFFFDGELLPVSLTITLQLAAVTLAQRALSSASRVWWGAAGFVMGLASLVTATSLVLVAVLAGAARRRFLIVLAGAVVAIAPATIHNLVRGGEPVLISFNGGINLYLGNNPEYDRTVAIRPDREWTQLTSEPSRAGARGYNAQSDFFVTRVRDYAIGDPVAFTRLQIKKVRLLIGGDEILRNHSVYPFREDSPLLATLLWKIPGLVFPWGLLLPLALVGLLYRGRRAPLLTVCLLVYAAAVVAFFITARYRLPLVPMLLIFAVEGVRWWFADAGSRQRGVAAVVAVVAFGFANLGQGAMPAGMNPDASYSLAVQLSDEGDKRGAEQLYREAIAEKDDYAEAWLNLGTLLLERGDAAEAASCFARAGEIDPEDADALVNLGNLRAARGEMTEALTLYRRAFALKPRHQLAMDNLEVLARDPTAPVVDIWGLLYEQHPGDSRFLGNLLTALEQQGEITRAVALLRWAVDRNPADAALRFTLGRLLVKSGKLSAGDVELRRALESGDPRVPGWIENNPDLRDRLGNLR